MLVKATIYTLCITSTEINWLLHEKIVESWSEKKYLFISLLSVQLNWSYFSVEKILNDYKITALQGKSNVSTQAQRKTL